MTRYSPTPRAADAVEVRDTVGNLLADGDQVTLIKDPVIQDLIRRPASFCLQVVEAAPKN